MTDPARDIDWEQIRRWKFATETPPSDWPAEVKAISFSGLNLFGIDVDNNLYWDGRRLQHITRLGRTERGLAWLVALSTVASAIFQGLELLLGK
ncbi:hypothetical protein ELI41_29625 (plasmid) [Rhizobium leguminosarum]|jgi:hypothetical protein|uniref:hypothetical protein n=1 Tax=Rhizobium leguminosarum TaxID=384 RepID=UPI001030148A|nr:hypothetical protein [Rhizobium leguminosarum]TAU80469.1 hypothetical protein ELI41_29625 [Rhizobium leguminosarum]